MNRYDRQERLPGWGREGQRRLSRSSAVQIGCGALGSTLATCMVRAGIGRYTIIDRDQADLMNLHRQFLFDEKDAERGAWKARAAARRLRRANSLVEIKAHAAELNEKNIGRLLAGHDLVLDALDNMETRYLVNEWCVKNRVPWIYGGVVGTCGMTMNILPGGPCLRCLWAEPAAPGILPTCATAGVINTAPAVIAALQATEAQKLLTGAGGLVTGLRVADLWTGVMQNIPVVKNPACPVCSESV